MLKASVNFALIFFPPHLFHNIIITSWILINFFLVSYCCNAEGERSFSWWLHLILSNCSLKPGPALQLVWNVQIHLFSAFFSSYSRKITPSISHTRRVLAFYNNTVNKRLSQMAWHWKIQVLEKAKEFLLSYAAYCKERASLFTRGILGGKDIYLKTTQQNQWFHQSSDLQCCTIWGLSCCSSVPQS